MLEQNGTFWNILVGVFKLTSMKCPGTLMRGLPRMERDILL
jgi:hypothetical protein